MPRLLVRDVCTLLTGSEGFRGGPYYDRTGDAVPTKTGDGYLTILYGRNLHSNPLTRAEGALIMRLDVRQKLAATKAMFPQSWHRINHVRRCALVEMAYNLGRAGRRRGYCTCG